MISCNCSYKLVQGNLRIGLDVSKCITAMAQFAGGGGFDRRERDDEGGFGGREDEGPSRADAADDWGTKKAFVPSGPSRGGGFSDRDRGGGFGDRERGGGFGDRDRGGGFGDRYSERRSGLGEGSLDRADTADK